MTKLPKGDPKMSYETKWLGCSILLKINRGKVTPKMASHGLYDGQQPAGIRFKSD